MEIVNKAQAMERLGGDEELYDEIVQVFLEDTPIQLENLRQALANNDDMSSVRLAHSLKSAAGNIGANAMREQALKMEQAGKSGGAKVIQTMFSELEFEFRKIEEYFKK